MSRGPPHTQPPPPPEQFDCVMLDAPCSALGQRPAVYNGIGLKEVKAYPPLQKAPFEQVQYFYATLAKDAVI